MNDKQVLAAVQMIFSHRDSLDGPLAECEACNDYMGRIQDSHAALRKRVEAQSEVVEAAREVDRVHSTGGGSVSPREAVARLREALDNLEEQTDD